MWLLAAERGPFGLAFYKWFARPLQRSFSGKGAGTGLPSRTSCLYAWRRRLASCWPSLRAGSRSQRTRNSRDSKAHRPRRWRTRRREPREPCGSRDRLQGAAAPGKADDLTQFEGVGDAKATLILAAIEFARRRIKPEGAKIETP